MKHLQDFTSHSPEAQSCAIESEAPAFGNREPLLGSPGHQGLGSSG